MGDVNNDDVMIINLIDDDDDDDDAPPVHPRDRILPSFNPAVYSFLSDDLLAHTPGSFVEDLLFSREPGITMALW
jgi:hypothetical protein